MERSLRYPTRTIILRPLLRYGAIAQLGERLHGMQEVDGSIPSGSTKSNRPSSRHQPWLADLQKPKSTGLGFCKSPSSRGLGHRPFTAVTGVRIPVGTPI